MRTSIAISLAAALTTISGHSPATAAPQSPHATLDVGRAASARRETALDSDWRFNRGDIGDAASTPGFDDGQWAHVDIPHTWDWIGSYNPTRDPRTDLYQGVGWYRLHFPTPRHQPGERTFLQFDGVGNVADVWLNGRKIGHHAGAFSRFRFDVTDALNQDGPNVLAVRADNSKREAGSPTANVLPLSGDFFIFGGIYRHVSLITTASAHFALLDHAGPGVYATTQRVEGGAATVNVRALLREQDGDAPLSVTLALDDASGKTVASRTVPARVTGGSGTASADLQVPDAHLWNGRADPYLYRLRAEIRRNGALTDRLVQQFGIRTFRIDPDKGFFLNGRHLVLHGVSRHQDRYGVGWAVSDADQRQDMAIIADLGANTVRAAHYQHAPIWYDLADQYGMIVWAEVPFVNQAGWTDRKGVEQPLLDNAAQQTRELIAQNFNHPSIVTWSVGNETDIVDLGKNDVANSRFLLNDLSAVAKRNDPSRPTTFADCCEPSDAPADPRPVHLAGAADMIGYNRYYGWYYGSPDELGPRLDLLHRRHPTLPAAVSEYGAGGAISQHTDDSRGGLPDSHGLIQPEEYQTWVLQRNWAAIKARPYLWSSWLWTMFDFASPRTEGDSTDLNTKGLVTSDRKTRKDAYYFIKAAWSQDPTLHLAQRRYVDRAYPVTDIQAFTNAPQARLTLDGRDQGVRSCVDAVCTWPQVHLAAGSNTVTVSAQIGGRMLSDTAVWNAPDPRLGLALNAGTLLSGQTSEGTRFGSDAFFTGGTAVTTKGAAGAGLDGAVADTLRQGRFTYDLPIPNGKWSLSLWFTDPKSGTGRRFSVTAQGQTVIAGIDVVSAAHGAGRVVRRVVPVEVRDGLLRLAFETGTGPALLSALQVTPAAGQGGDQTSHRSAG